MQRACILGTGKIVRWVEVSSNGCHKNVIHKTSSPRAFVFRMLFLNTHVYNGCHTEFEERAVRGEESTHLSCKQQKQNRPLVS